MYVIFVYLTAPICHKNAYCHHIMSDMKHQHSLTLAAAPKTLLSIRSFILIYTLNSVREVCNLQKEIDGDPIKYIPYVCR